MSNNNYIINKTFDNQSSITTSSINVKTINDVLASQIVYVDVSNNISTENVMTFSIFDRNFLILIKKKNISSKNV